MKSDQDARGVPASKENRDPRINPMSGDELIGGKSQRYVGRLFPDGSIGFTYWRIGFNGGRGNDCVTSLLAWRKWAKGARVLLTSPVKSTVDDGGKP